MSGLMFWKKIHFLRLDLKGPRAGFYRRGRGRSINVEGPKREQAQTAVTKESQWRRASTRSRLLQVNPFTAMMSLENGQ